MYRKSTLIQAGILFILIMVLILINLNRYSKYSKSIEAMYTQELDRHHELDKYTVGWDWCIIRDTENGIDYIRWSDGTKTVVPKYNANVKRCKR